MGGPAASSGRYYEIRDPVHVFIRLSERERELIDTPPFQRLRDIHQLGMTYLVYPGATHRRFEHSLGVMELASRIFDVVTHEQNRRTAPHEAVPHQLDYWRETLRAAALCHDLGHLPFSHAAEKELLPKGRRHEHLTRDLVLADPVRSVLADKHRPELQPEDVAKLAVGKKYIPDAQWTDWEILLSEIITGDIFGADRMDYLIRDSLHAGVAYGRFDHHRLVETLRLVPSVPEKEKAAALAIGIEHGGVQSAEALLLARYLMYQQVYFHPVRRAYDLHYRRFMEAVVGKRKYPTGLQEHLNWTDSRVMWLIQEAARDSARPGHEHARRIHERDHFRVVYECNPEDAELCRDPGKHLRVAARRKYGAGNADGDAYTDDQEWGLVPVLGRDGKVRPINEVSRVAPPLAQFDYVFVRSDLAGDAKAWLEGRKSEILKKAATKIYED